MCGIAGFFTRAEISQKRITKLRDGIRERGTDNFGELLGFDPHTTASAFYHARLSIIDVGTRSDQPFGKPGHKTKLVYNGEVYNFRELRDELRSRFSVIFETDGDTEVVYEGLRCMGQDFISKISGEFAFCFYDFEGSQLILARDTFGKKPLSFSRKGQEFLFSSNEKSIGDLIFNYGDFEAFCAVGYVPEKMPLFSGATIVEPNSIITVDLKTFDIDISNIQSNIPGGNALRQTVAKSVKSQMTADVPVGVFLSGGLDSTLVASVAAEISPKLDAFSFISDDNQSEESLIDEWLQQTGVEFKVNKLHSSEINVPDELLTVIPKLYRPTADSSIVPTNALMRMARDSGVKVVLTGLGGDEMFCGYNRYLRRKSLAKFNFSFLEKIAVALNHFPMFRLSKKELDLAISSFIDTTFFNNLPSRDKIRVADAVSAFLRPDTLGSGLKKMMNIDRNNYTIDLLHRQYDVISLLHDVEIRSPLLDIEISKSIDDIPDTLLLRKGRLKNIQKDYFNSYFTASQLTASKQGFSGPVPVWVEKYEDFFNHYSRNGYINENFGVQPSTVNDKWVYSCVNIWLSQF